MTDPAQLCVLRHGETDWNQAGILQGWIDVPLNAKGRRQSLDLAASFSSAGLATIWTSPLVRAWETAVIVAGALRLRLPRCHEGLKERNFGAVQGVPKSELADLNPLLLQQILRRNPAADFETGETMDVFADRVLDAIAEIGKRHAGERVLVITHGWVMDVIARHVEGLPRSAMLNHKPKNGEGLWLEVQDESIRRATTVAGLTS